MDNVARVTLLSQQSRTGTVRSSETTIPDAPLETALVEWLLTDTDMRDNTTDVAVTVSVSVDGGTTWRVLGGGAWGGRSDVQKNGATRAWGLGIGGLSRFRNALLRADVESQTTRSVGLAVTT